MEESGGNSSIEYEGKVGNKTKLNQRRGWKKVGNFQKRVWLSQELENHTKKREARQLTWAICQGVAVTAGTSVVAEANATGGSGSEYDI